MIDIDGLYLRHSQRVIENPEAIDHVLNTSFTLAYIVVVAAVIAMACLIYTKKMSVRRFLIVVLPTVVCIAAIYTVTAFKCSEIESDRRVYHCLIVGDVDYIALRQKYKVLYRDKYKMIIEDKPHKDNLY